MPTNKEVQEFLNGRFVHQGMVVIWPEQLMERFGLDFDNSVNLLGQLVQERVLLVSAQWLSGDGYVMWSGPVNDLPPELDFPSESDPDDFGDGGVRMKFELAPAIRNALSFVPDQEKKLAM